MKEHCFAKFRADKVLRNRVIDPISDALLQNIDVVKEKLSRLVIYAKLTLTRARACLPKSLSITTSIAIRNEQNDDVIAVSVSRWKIYSVCMYVKIEEIVG